MMSNYSPEEPTHFQNRDPGNCSPAVYLHRHNK
jgi:hypothetical protein